MKQPETFDGKSCDSRDSRDGSVNNDCDINESSNITQISNDSI